MTRRPDRAGAGGYRAGIPNHGVAGGAVSTWYSWGNCRRPRRGVGRPLRL